MTIEHCSGFRSRKLAPMVIFISIIVVILKYSVIAVILILAAIGAKTVAHLFKLNEFIAHPASAAFEPSDQRIRQGAVVAIPTS